MTKKRKIIDSHAHIYMHVQERFKFIFDEAASFGIEEVGLQSLASYSAGSEAENLDIFHIKNNPLSVKIRAFPSLHEFGKFAEIPYEKQIEEIFALNPDGIKFLQMKPNVRKVIGKGLCDESYDKTLSLIAERGLPITLHCADPETFWDITKVTPSAVEKGWFYGGEGYLTFEEHHEETLRMLDKHRDLKVILAHFFFLDESYDEACRVLETYPNVYFDLTPHGRIYKSFSNNTELWRNFIIKYQDRIIFGTDADNEREYNRNIYNTMLDSFECEGGKYVFPGFYRGEEANSLMLPESVIEKICYKNFVSVAGDEPKVTDNSKLLDSTERALYLIKDDPECSVQANRLAGYLRGEFGWL